MANNDNFSLKEKVILLKGMLAIILLDNQDALRSEFRTEHACRDSKSISIQQIRETLNLIREELNYPTTQDLENMISNRRRVLAE